MGSDLLTTQDILKIIKRDPWMTNILKTTRSADLPDWWIGAGFVRNKIWDTLHGFKKRTPLNDIDIIYFDEKNTDESIEKEIEKRLYLHSPNEKWSVKNQKRLADLKSKEYNSSKDALYDWVETATCIAIKLNQGNSLSLVAPHGIKDLVSLTVRKTPGVPEEVYQTRLKEKDWLKKWPNLKIIT